MMTNSKIKLKSEHIKEELKRNLNRKGNHMIIISY